MTSLTNAQRQADTHSWTYKAGGVHLPPADQVGDVLSVVGDGLHAAHEAVSTS